MSAPFWESFFFRGQCLVQLFCVLISKLVFVLKYSEFDALCDSLLFSFIVPPLLGSTPHPPIPFVLSRVRHSVPRFPFFRSTEFPVIFADNDPLECHVLFSRCFLYTFLKIGLNGVLISRLLCQPLQSGLRCLFL